MTNKICDNCELYDHVKHITSTITTGYCQKNEWCNKKLMGIKKHGSDTCNEFKLREDKEK